VPTRRNFLQSAAVVSAAPLAPKVVFADGSQQAVNIGVVYDSRHIDARAFALRAEQWGAPLRRIEGDITELWQTELQGRWREMPVAIAGLTERPALFLLERLSWDYGMRVVYQAEHETNGRGQVSHDVVRSESRGLKSQLEAAGKAWAAMLTGSGDVSSQDTTPTSAAMAASLDEPVKLYSWIIAPKPAA
jgi:hypothetical protein